MMMQRSGSPLRAWLSFFDKNTNNLCSLSEFRLGMKALRHSGRVETFWEELDVEKLDFITLEAIDEVQGKLWHTFRKWAGQKFDGPKDMVHQLRQAAGAVDTSDGIAEE